MHEATGSLGYPEHRQDRLADRRLYCPVRLPVTLCYRQTILAESRDSRGHACWARPILQHCGLNAGAGVGRLGSGPNRRWYTLVNQQRNKVMAICPHCGGEANVGYETCPNCGGGISWGDTPKDTGCAGVFWVLLIAAPFLLFFGSGDRLDQTGFDSFIWWLGVGSLFAGLPLAVVKLLTALREWVLRE